MIEIIIVHTLKNIKNTLLAILATKLYVLIRNLVNQLLFTGEEMFIEAILRV